MKMKNQEDFKHSYEDPYNLSKCSDANNGRNEEFSNTILWTGRKKYIIIVKSPLLCMGLKILKQVYRTVSEN